MSFTDLGLLPELMNALVKLGLTDALPIQRDAYTPAVAGEHVYLLSPTGSGKTLAYLLPLFSRIDLSRDATQVLILAPTHELALQIHRVACDLAQHAGMAMRSVLLIGGTSLDRQIEKLKKKPHLVVGTPGRVGELAEKGKLKVKDCVAAVVDEADRMLAGDSTAGVLKVLKSCPAGCQFMYVSATERPESSQVISELSPELMRIDAGEEQAAPNLEHLYMLVEDRDKPDTVRKFIHAADAQRVMVFTHRAETAEIVTAKLNHHKLPAADLHGAFKKDERKKAMDGFRSGKIRVLIASDVGARGLDIPGITHVVNLDMPGQPKDYLHRVGRAGRAGATGVAMSLVIEQEKRTLSRIHKELGITLKQAQLRNGKLLIDG